MEKIALPQVIDVVNGKVVAGNLNSEYIVESVVIDSRIKTRNGLFFALIGDNTDGHEHISMAKENGVVAAVISHELDSYDENIVYILVKDTLKALQELATWYFSKFNVLAVGITGSVGKTTGKEMIASVLSRKYNVLKTEGNFNSEIGVPLTALSLNSSHEIAVIEMGMDHIGEIYNSSKIIKPDTAVITNIGIAHIEHLKTRENIFKAKTEVFQNMKDNGVVILNKDDDMLVTIDDEMDKIWFGYDELSDIRALTVDVDYTEGIVKAELMINGNKYMVNIPGLSKHLVDAALMGIAVGLRYNMDISDIIKGIESYKGIKMRMNIKKLDNNITLIDDTYNANPVSMKSLINTLSASNKSVKTIIIGDMFELGSESFISHKEVMEYALNKGINNVIAIGQNMKDAYGSLDDNIKQNIKIYDKKEDVYGNLLDYLTPDSVIAVKASRAMKFEDIVNKIIEVI